MTRVTRGLVGAALLTLLAALALSACGGGGSSSSGSTEPAPESEEKSETTTASEGDGGDAMAEAKKIIAPYIGHPSAFPVTEKLNKVPKGAKIAYPDCGNPVCALFYELLQPAAQTMGVSVERVKAGETANGVASAFETIVSQEPDAVITPAIPIELWTKQLKELQADEIPVVTAGIANTEEYGIETAQASNAYAEEAATLMANYVVSEMNPEANVVITYTPEVSTTTLLTDKFIEELEAICPDCSAEKLAIKAEEDGTTAPNTEVSYLQSHPDANLMVFSSDEMSNGAPQAFQAAGIDIETLGAAPGPVNLQYIKEGKQTAALATDLPVLIWTLLDQAAREMTGQELTGPEAEGLVDLQFLTQKDITFDPSKGWTGYPDFAERFAKLWGAAAP